MLTLLPNEELHQTLSKTKGILLAFEGPSPDAGRALQLFRNSEIFPDAGHHGAILKELKIAGHKVHIAVVAHYDAANHFWLEMPDYLLEDKDGKKAIGKALRKGQDADFTARWRLVDKDSTVSEKVRDQITEHEPALVEELKQIALDVLVGNGLVEEAEAAKAKKGYVFNKASDYRRQPSRPGRRR